MTCEPYITVDEFKNSLFYCHFPDCCITGNMTNTYIENFIGLAQKTVESYMGWDICLSERRDTFTGDDSNSYFLNYIPLSVTGNVSINYRQHRSVVSTGVITNYYIEDQQTGLVRNDQRFRIGTSYNIIYEAGYNPIPAQIKQAMCMLVLNLAQRLDNQNMNNPDLSIDSININKVAVAQFGSSKMVKQVMMKSMRDLIDLPVPVARILDRYRYGSSI